MWFGPRKDSDSLLHPPGSSPLGFLSHMLDPSCGGRLSYPVRVGRAVSKGLVALEVEISFTESPFSHNRLLFRLVRPLTASQVTR